MARDDHYVSQAYLRGFVGPTGDIVPYYKDAQVIVGRPKKPKSICYETEGDRCKYLREPRAIDRFLPQFENHWKSNVARVQKGGLEPDVRFELCGYIAYLRACSPVAKRLCQTMVAGILEPVVYQHMTQDLETNDSLNADVKMCLKEAVYKKEINIRINREFAHAQNLAAIIGILSRLYCSHWLVMINESDIPFITSDNPAILHHMDEMQRPPYTYVPLNPGVAVLITPDLCAANSDLNAVKEYDCTEKSRFAVVERSAVVEFNEAIVKNAERLVLHREKLPWLEELVHQYRHWRTEMIVSHLPANGGTFTLTSVQPVATSKLK